MKTKVLPTEITIRGETMYVTMRKPNWFRYQWRMIVLFFGIVCWKPWRWSSEHNHDWCLSPKTAWSVAWGLNTYRHDLKVWRAYP